MKDFEKEFYSQIGLLSVQFAKMEYKLSAIVSTLIGVEDNTIAVTIVEKNNLSQNIEFLIKLNRIQEFQETKVDELIKRVKKVKGQRNLFIHGIWKDPIETKTGIKVVCEERRIKYTITKDEKGRLVSRNWSFNRHYTFDLIEIQKEIVDITEIINLEDKLIEILEDEGVSKY